ncbi:autotransporter domain-containing protein [Nitrospirillum viridazoti]|uniref:Outer membrane lipase/esterase n=1 Tax=Nitrospirillum amazonense TaxID=28077 RepID=A0A560HQD5_9PROT|nr:autotransporter domain-containing protein [Nitrospirillum amazonense]TWB48645.1 outer membrane lipase/esterase [Nitrospirillum amazonense]
MTSRMLRTTTAMAVALMASFVGFTAHAQQYSAGIVFGDSLSDPGNLVPLGLAPPPPYYNGRFSNGPLWDEKVGALIGGVPFKSYAYGGARSTAERPIDFLNQINAFLAAKPTITSSQLYSLWIGANDYFQYATSGSSVDAATEAATVVGNIGTGASKLIAAGARNFLVFNLPNLGNTPSISAQGADASLQANQLTAIHNADVLALTKSLNGTSGARVILVDVNTIFSMIQANPSAYGITDATHSCLLGGKATGYCTPANINTMLFWDDVHPTTTGHTLVAEYVAGTLTTVLQAPQAAVAATQLNFIADDGMTGSVRARLNGIRSGTAVAGVGGGMGTGTSTGRDGRVGIFLYGNYGTGDRDAIAGQMGYTYDSYTGALGVDYRVSDYVTTGVALGYGDNRMRFQGGFGKDELHAYNLMAYATANMGAFYADGMISYGYDEFTQMQRQTGFAPQPWGNATPNGSTYGASLSGGYNVTLGNVALGPTAGLRYTRASIHSYTEKDAGALALSVPDFDAESFRAQAGGQLAIPFVMGDMVVAPQIQAGVQHEFLNSGRIFQATLPGGQVAETDAGAGKRTSYYGGGGIAIQANGFNVAVSYQGTFDNGDRTDHAVMGHIRVGF